MQKVLFSSLVVAAILALGSNAMFAQAAAGAADNRTGTSEKPVTDTWITTKVKAELATTDGVKSTDVEVKTTNGIVALRGTLATETAIRKAIDVAKSVKGVKQVDASNLKSKE